VTGLTKKIRKPKNVSVVIKGELKGQIYNFEFMFSFER